MSALFRISVQRLGRDLSEASELAAVLQEISPSLSVDGCASTREHSAPSSTCAGGGSSSSSRPSSACGTPKALLSLRDRVLRAEPIDIAPSEMRWRDLVAVVPSDLMQAPSSDGGGASSGDQQQQQQQGGGGQVVHVHSGGAVFFLLFAAPRDGGDGGSSGDDGGSARDAAQQQQQQQQQQRPSPLGPSADAGDAPPATTKATAGGWPRGGTGRRAQRREGVAVAKFPASRLAAQAEQFASELARYLGVAAPPCRVVRAAPPSSSSSCTPFGCDGPAEWGEARAAAEALVADSGSGDGGSGSSGADRDSGGGGGGGAGDGGAGVGGATLLLQEFARLPCFLLMEYVPGRPLLEAVGPALSAVAERSEENEEEEEEEEEEEKEEEEDDADKEQGSERQQRALLLLSDVGRLLLLDLLLGNADRLPLADLGWRGNPANVILGAPGAVSRYAGRAVAIDSSVPRRPPALKSCAEDAAAERLVQLALAAPPEAAEAVLSQLLGADAAGALAGAGGAVEAFRAGLKGALERAARIRGLLEMAQGVTAGWVASFLDDVAPLVPGLKGPQGAALPVPVSELAAGMRTPPHLASPRPASSRPPSARPSPRGSFLNCDPGAAAAATAAGPFAAAGGPATGGGGGGGGSPTPPLPMRANSRGAARSPLLAPAPPRRAHSGSLAGSLQLPCSPTSSAGGLGAAADLETPPGCGGSKGGGGCGGAGGEGGALPQALRGGAFARLSPRALFSGIAPDGTCSAGGAPRVRAASPAAPPPQQQQQQQHLRRIGSAASPTQQRSPRDPVLGGPEARAASASSSLSAAVSSALASIANEARHDGALAERVASWKERLRARSAALSAAIADWQARRGSLLEDGAALTTGFLDGSANPLVDAYELTVRLEHLLRRLGALCGAAAAQAPCEVAPGVFLGGAVAADSHHLLRHLGVTHVLNATEELLPPPPSAGFESLRLPLRDDESEDVAFHFERAADWIEAALAGGGAVLVHCHEGRSRSVTLVAAWLMKARGLPLTEALARIREARPEARPNAAFLSALADLERSLGSTAARLEPVAPGAAQGSSKERALLLLSAAARPGKPAARVCPLCGEAVGVSSVSLEVHLRARHREGGGAGLN